MRTSFWGLLIAALSLGLLAPAAQAAGSIWIETWAAPPSPPNLVERPHAPLSPSFAGQTLREVVRLSAGGTRVRIRFTNEYGTTPLHIGAAHVALAADQGAIQPASDRAITFNGKAQAIIPPGAPMLSDPIDLAAAPLSTLSISLYLPDATGPCTCHPLGMQTSYLSGPGDFTAAAAFPVQATARYRAFISGVEVQADPSAGVIATLGDSITDGAVSTPDANQRWPDRLAQRLAALGAGSAVLGVANEGISGNRLLADGAGVSALARFDRDVLSVPGVRYVVVLIGVNDLGVAYGPGAAAHPVLNPPTADDMIAGYKQLIARAHEHGLKIFGATITPYGGAGYWSSQGETYREAINTWIRTGGAFDGVLDFDAVWRDPDHPTHSRAEMDPGDHLHGTDAAYRALGDSIDLGLFR